MQNRMVAIEALQDQLESEAEIIDLPDLDILDESVSDALDAARIPHISIDVFVESDAFSSVWHRAEQDRHMVTATLSTESGGFRAAISKYSRSKTPDLVIVETHQDESGLIVDLDAMAEVCDEDTRLIVVGHCNDISLYQKLLNLGISNYIVFPVTAPDLITAISDVYAEPGREKIGKITAVVGAKGGVGASAIAHNVALEVAEQSSADVLLVDLDVCFGTATLDLDIEANQGLGEVLDQAERLDAAMLDRVLVKRGEHLCLLGTPPNLETDVTIDEFGIERLLETASSHIPHIVLDLPHLWAPWMRRAMAMADRAVIVGTPEIGCLRNVATLMTQLKSIRPNDQSPVLALNQIGLPGRQELTLREISSVLKVPSLIAIPYDAKTFNRAAASAKMLREVGPRKPVVKAIGEIARAIAPPPERRKKRTRSLWRR